MQYAINYEPFAEPFVPMASVIHDVLRDYWPALTCVGSQFEMKLNDEVTLRILSGYWMREPENERNSRWCCAHFSLRKDKKEYLHHNLKYAPNKKIVSGDSMITEIEMLRKYFAK